MKKYTNIIFDVDGTLIDSRASIIRSLKKALNVSDSSENNINFEEIMGITDRDAAIKLGIKDIDDFLEKWKDELSSYDGTYQLFSGMRETLVLLKEYGYKLGIITSMPGISLRSIFSNMHIYNLFDTIVTSDMTKAHKPSPEPMYKYMELSNTCPDELIYIGDSYSDCNCALNSGVDFIEATWGSGGYMESLFDIEKPTDLIEIFKPQ